MNVMFDIDGVLADFIFGYTSEAVRMGYLDKPLTFNDQVGWDEFGNMTPNQVHKVWDKVLRDGNFWLSLNPLVNEKVFQDINKLNSNYNVVFVTKRDGLMVQSQTKLWLIKHGVSNPSIILTKRKGEIARALDMQFSIEDKAENAAVIHWIADSVPCKSYLINRTYNLDASIPKNVKRINSVEQYINDVCEGISI